MAKRANPFTDDFVQQSKVHVGVKQVNNNEECLKQVYEKTLKLLYNGARNIPSSKIEKHNDLNGTCLVMTNVRRDNLKQLYISRDGRLQHSLQKISPRTNIISHECNCTKSVNNLCTYCEVIRCDVCLDVCSLCHCVYCSQCLLTGLEDSQICISCYR